MTLFGTKISNLCISSKVAGLLRMKWETHMQGWLKVIFVQTTFFEWLASKCAGSASVQ